jgi:hypothetical protein
LKLNALVVLLLLCLVPAAADAQPPDSVRMRIGPLFVNPTIALSNAGVDTNVFNDATIDSPKQDFTVTVTPATNLWLRMGRSWLTSNIREDIVYYQKYSSERSANSAYKVSWMFPFNRVTFNSSATYNHTRDRPGFEVDARSERAEVGYSGTAEVRFLSKTFFGVRGDRQSTAFDKDAVFLGASLHDELSRTVTGEAVSIRHQATPLTSITLEVTREQDRFEFSPLRDSNSTQIAGSIKFDPAALIKGSASVGYRDFEPVSAGLPSFLGTTVAVDLSYVLLGVTRFGVKASRDVQYSFDVNQPYYVQSGINFDVSQQIFGPVDAVGRLGGSRLEYRDRVGAAVAVSDRIDHVQSYGGGVGYHLGRDTRLGFNIDRNQRLSPVSGREYKGLKFGVAVTYGS